MYVPKSEDGSTPKMTLPMGAFTSSPGVKSTLAPPLIIPRKQTNEVWTQSMHNGFYAQQITYLKLIFVFVYLYAQSTRPPATVEIPSSENNNRRRKVGVNHMDIYVLYLQFLIYTIVFV